jgi:CheY-like chemotaxis protein
MKKYKTVLMIDDNDIDGFVTKKIIEKSGFAKNVILKKSAFKALEYLRSNDSSGKNFPDIIFLDLRMPEMDGFKFLDEFEKLNNDSSNNCKIVVFSSSIDTDDYNRVKNNKFVKKYIRKPISMEAIKEFDF